MFNIAAIRTEHASIPVVVEPDRGVVSVERLVPDWADDAMRLLNSTIGAELMDKVAALADDEFVPVDAVEFDAPYRRPRKIWGIGLNYGAHAGDLDSNVPEEPASFVKGDHTIVGAGDPIVLPEQSRRVTAEAELGLVIGSYCRNVSEEEALDYVWGVTPVLDQTAEDILLRNTRFLTRCKNFPTFFSFGPTVTPLSSVRQTFHSLNDITVHTVKNGESVRNDDVRNMRFSPAFLVSFHSKIMPLFPGDIISPGTPGAVSIEDGDVVRCEIPGIGELENPVHRPAASTAPK